MTAAKEHPSTSSILSWIEEWYLSHCNSEWEHTYGVKIDTIDNPGWSVAIDLHETALQNATMEKLHIETSKNDWISCEVSEARFSGHGDPKKLGQILEVFRGWVEAHG